MPSPAEWLDVPETLGYRVKRRLLGPPLINDQLQHERLSTPIALGVLSPDCISSSAYGTEEMLIELLKGGAAFAAILLYSAPVWVALFSLALHHSRWPPGQGLLEGGRLAGAKVLSLAIAQCARGSGRTWICTARGFEPLPPSFSHGVRSPLVLHSPRPFQPAFGSSMRPSKPLAKKLSG